MVELLVAMTLLTLIVLALMAVFNSTQRAFRASVTQTDILEGSRVATDMIARDLSSMVPSGYASNYYNGGVNFFMGTNYYYYAPLTQTLPGTSARRTNALEYFYVLGRQNTKWTGAGYVVNASSSSPLYPLYRFYAETNISYNPAVLFSNFLSTVYYAQVYTNQWTNLSHVIDGVVHLKLRAYDLQGYQITNTIQYRNNQWVTNGNIIFMPALTGGEIGMTFYTNMVPAALDLEMGVLEDRTLQRAESLGISGYAPAYNRTGPQWLYLQNQSGHVYLFRQHVAIPNVDPSAYQ